jgi:hypothetical protein
MKIYRIIALMHHSGDHYVEYVIERHKGFLFKRWKEVDHNEDGRSMRVSHKTYENAEQYLLDEYTKHGIGSLVTRSGNVYYVEPYGNESLLI